MSPTLRKIDIPEPCKAGKEHMSPSERGKMCSLCQKEVIDFRNMPSKQVIDYLKNNPKTCGSFWKGQVNWINQRLSQGQPQRVPYSFSNNRTLFLASLAAMVFVPVGLVAQEGQAYLEKAPVEQVDSAFCPSATESTAQLDSVEYFRLDGVVTVVMGDINTYPEDEQPSIWGSPAELNLPGQKKKEGVSNAPPPQKRPSFWQRMQAVLRRKDEYEL